MNTIQEQLTAAKVAIKSGNFAQAETISRKLLAQDLQPEEKATALLYLSESLRQRGLAKESLPYNQEALAIAEKLQNKELQAKALGDLGNGYSNLYDYSRALEYYHQALAIDEQLGNKSGVALWCGNIGIVHLNLHEYSRALEYYHQALAIDEQLGNKSGVATWFGNIGIVYWELSDYPRALEYYHQALAIQEEISNKSGMATNLGNIGNVYLDLYNYSRALEYYHQALSLNRELDRKINMAHNLGNIGTVYSDLSDYPRALEYYQQTLTIFEEVGNEQAMALVLGNIGYIYANLSEYVYALDYYHQALTLLAENGNQQGVTFLVGIGCVYAKQDFANYNPIMAEDYLLKAVGMMKEVGIKRELYSAYKQLSDLYAQEGRWQEHAEYLEKYYEAEKEDKSEEAKKLADKFAFERQIAVMEKEREVTDMLLHKFLPSPVVNEVKAKEGKILVQQFNSISVLFADLVGFTKLSLSIKPEIMIEMLNFIFTKFDSIIKENGGHRIRTMGDGYFAICGAPDLVENHQYKLAKAALKFMEDIILPENIRKHLPEGTVLDIRIGLHCGEAVCGMVGGLEKWQYDAYGDTINTASRMESHGEAGKIHISEDFKHALAEYDEFTFIPREPMFIKGKGMMNTYFLQ